MNISELFNVLEVELTKKKIISNNSQNKIFDALNMLKKKVYMQLDESAKIIGNRVDILKNADLSAREIVNKANIEVDSIINNSDIINLAQNKADDILKCANERDKQLKKELNVYINAKLLQCEKLLMELLRKFRQDRLDLTDE